MSRVGHPTRRDKNYSLRGTDFHRRVFDTRAVHSADLVHLPYLNLAPLPWRGLFFPGGPPTGTGVWNRAMIVTLAEKHPTQQPRLPCPNHRSDSARPWAA